MGDFGFDPYIVSNLQTAGNQNSNNDMQTLADLVGKRTQNQVAQYGLQRQQGLADIVRQNAGAFSSNPYAQALAQGGYGQEAFEAQKQAIELGQQMFAIHRSITASRLSAADTPAKIRAIVKGLPEDVQSSYAPPDPSAPDGDLMDWKKNFLTGQLSPEQQAENANKAAANRHVAEIAPGQYGVFDANTNAVTPIQGSGATMLQGPALEAAVDQFHAKGGVMPELGTDPGGLKANAIRTRAAEKYKNDNLAGNEAAFKANSASLENYQKTADATSGFIKTLDKNIKGYEEAAAKVPTSSMPLLNKLIRNYQTDVSGDPALTKMKVMLQGINSEAAKINSGSQGGSPPLATLEEVTSNLPPNASKEQVAAALQAYRLDSKNRIDAVHEQLAAIKGRLGGEQKSGGGSAKPAKKAAPKDASSHPQAIDALSWARANKGKDTRADEILKRLGVQ